MTPREVLAFCREKDVKAVALRFADLFGAWRQITIPLARLEPAAFDDGFGCDGSLASGWQGPQESDLLLVPQADTAFLDPFAATPTLALLCNVIDPLTGDAYSRDPRQVATKAANYLRSTGIADTACFAPKAEFMIFDAAEFGQSAAEGYYHLDASDPQGLADLGSEMLQGMHDCSLEAEALHESALGPGKLQIDLRFQPLVKMADWLLVYKHVARNVARRNAKLASFMPQPLGGDADPGSGMATHFSLWKDDEPLFAGGGYAGLSDLALYAIGGILRHAPALCAFTNPTTNSYKRLAAGGEAPLYLAYGERNRSAACRVPAPTHSLRTKRVEFRCPDPSSNPYLAFAAILMAAIDGIQLKLHPGQPIEKNLHSLSEVELAEVPRTPATLDDALRALEADCDFLLRDDVFTSDVLETWIHHKRQREIEPLRRRPHPHEFSLYFDA